MSRQTLNAILDEINANPETLEVHKRDFIITMFFQEAFSPSKKWDFADEKIEYKSDSDYATNNKVYYEIPKFKRFRNRMIANPVKRMNRLIDMLESVSSEDAEIIMLVKDQALTTKYPNITAKLMFDNGIISEEDFEQWGTSSETIKEEVTAEVTAEVTQEVVTSENVTEEEFPPLEANEVKTETTTQEVEVTSETASEPQTETEVAPTVMTNEIEPEVVVNEMPKQPKPKSKTKPKSKKSDKK